MTTTTGTSTTAASQALFAAINKANGYSSSTEETGTSTDTSQELQESFLTLLMAQLQNQDPLNPLENTELTSQLSQINMVSGIQSVNSTLTQMMSAFSEAQGLQTAAVIGKSVLAPGNNMPLTDEGTAAGILLDSAADTVKVTIKDSSGVVVQTTDLGAQSAGTVTFAWDGVDASGNQRASGGNYTFTVEATANGEKVTNTPLQIGTVNAVVRDTSGNFVLDLGSYGTTTLASVQQIL